MFKKVKVAFVAVALVSAFASSAFANLTGKWKCDDGGMYYVRQVGSDVFWYGEKLPLWSNVAHGTYVNGKLNLRWADVPKGNSTGGTGTLTLQALPPGPVEKTMQRVAGTGSGFGGKLWTRIP